MKKLLPFLLVLFIGVSCSESEDALISNPAANTASRPKPVDTRLDPTKLARVIFYPQTANERIWFFYPNGLLRRITKHDGTLVQSFTYDGSSNLIKTVYISEGWWSASYTNTYTYNNSNHITSINGQTVQFNASENRYVIGNPDTPNHIDINLNSDLTFESIHRYYQQTNDEGNLISFDNFDEIAGYLNGNMQSYYIFDSPSSSFFTHDNKTNPLKVALYPICKAYSVRCYFNNTNGLWRDSECNSQNNIIHQHYEFEDPERYNYVYEFNALNLPIKRTTLTYQFSTLESTAVTARYYYQGDIIPNN